MMFKNIKTGNLVCANDKATAELMNNSPMYEVAHFAPTGLSEECAEFETNDSAEAQADNEDSAEVKTTRKTKKK